MFERYFGNKKLVCFDFDGLLVNTEPLHHKAYTLVLEQLNAPLHLDFETYCLLAHDKDRDRFYKAVKKAFPLFSYSWEQVRKLKIDLYSTLLQSDPVALMEGADELIGLLHNAFIDTCIVTNSFRPDVEKIIAHHPILQSIPVIISKEDYLLPKPSPDGYLRALQLYSIESKEAIGLEDSIKGVTALNKASIDALFIHPTHQEATHTSLKELISNVP
jgi:HAD superfamily hydrolase (TIGR01509 family)